MSNTLLDRKKTGRAGSHCHVAAVVTAILAVLDRHGIDGAALYLWFFPTAEEYTTLMENRIFFVTDIPLAAHHTQQDYHESRKEEP